MSKTVLVRGVPWLTLAATALLAGCGEEDGDRAAASASRGPLPVVVGVVVDLHGVQISPRAIGAGPVRLLVANQSGAPATVALSGGGSARLRLRLAPRGVRTVRSTLSAGELRVQARTRTGTRRALLRLGAPRPSSDDEPMTP